MSELNTSDTAQRLRVASGELQAADDAVRTDQSNLTDARAAAKRAEEELSNAQVQARGAADAFDAAGAAHLRATLATVGNVPSQLDQIQSAVTELQKEGTTMTTAIETLNATLDNIQGDVTGLKDALTALGAANETTIADLQAQLAAALALSDPAAQQAAVDAAVAAAQASFDASLQAVVEKAASIDAETPAVEPPPVA